MQALNLEISNYQAISQTVGFAVTHVSGCVHAYGHKYTTTFKTAHTMVTT